MPREAREGGEGMKTASQTSRPSRDTPSAKVDVGGSTALRRCHAPPFASPILV
jgi:hypothetical protein